MIAGSFRLAGMCSFVGSCMSCCYQWKRRRRRWWCYHAFVMVIDYLFRVVHAAVTDLDGVSVEDFS